MNQRIIRTHRREFRRLECKVEDMGYKVDTTESLEGWSEKTKEMGFEVGECVKFRWWIVKN